jgi:alpha-L-fucosidase
MGGDGNVVVWDNDSTRHLDMFQIPEKITKATWLDNGKEIKFEKDGENVNLYTVPFAYGTNLIIRVAKIEIEK